jgi:hypothetical protein
VRHRVRPRPLQLSVAGHATAWPAGAGRRPPQGPGRGRRVATVSSSAPSRRARPRAACAGSAPRSARSSSAAPAPASGRQVRRGVRSRSPPSSGRPRRSRFRSPPSSSSCPSTKPAKASRPPGDAPAAPRRRARRRDCGAAGRIPEPLPPWPPRLRSRPRSPLARESLLGLPGNVVKHLLAHRHSALPVRHLLATTFPGRSRPRVRLKPFDCSPVWTRF